MAEKTLTTSSPIGGWIAWCAGMRAAAQPRKAEVPVHEK